MAFILETEGRKGKGTEVISVLLWRLSRHKKKQAGAWLVSDWNGRVSMAEHGSFGPLSLWLL